eukprot:7378390-Prymnesium_polylepis.1
MWHARLNRTGCRSGGCGSSSRPRRRANCRPSATTRAPSCAGPRRAATRHERSEQPWLLCAPPQVRCRQNSEATRRPLKSDERRQTAARRAEIVGGAASGRAAARPPRDRPSVRCREARAREVWGRLCPVWTAAGLGGASGCALHVGVLICGVVDVGRSSPVPLPAARAGLPGA